MDLIPEHILSAVALIIALASLYLSLLNRSEAKKHSKREKVLSLRVELAELRELEVRLSSLMRDQYGRPLSFDAGQQLSGIESRLQKLTHGKQVSWSVLNDIEVNLAEIRGIVDTMHNTIRSESDRSDN